MEWQRLFTDRRCLVLPRATLDSCGATRRQIADAMNSGQLVRVRRGFYVLPDTPKVVVQAIRIGGRVACVSTLSAARVFVFDRPATHVQLEPSTPRIRSPHNSAVSFDSSNRGGCRLHWRPLIDPTTAAPHTVGPIDAVVQSMYCQPERMAIATLDSAVHLGYLRDDQLGEVFRNLPGRFQRIRPLIDGRCESGLESVFRLMLVEAGLPFELQVHIPRVGDVDFLIAGKIVVETDGLEFHGPATARRDYSRDLELAALGYVVIRLNYQQVMFDQPGVLRAIHAAIGTLRVHNVGKRRR